MDKEEEKNPTLVDKGFNLAKSLLRYATEGFPNVSQDIYEKRMLICNSCESLNKKKAICKLCGCHVEYKGRMETESCPSKKW